MTTTRVVLLARGLGSRMRAHDDAASLTTEQRQAADTGAKAMMPIHGRPFLDYILSGLADAGLSDVGLIVAPDHAGMRRYYESASRLARVTLAFLVQEHARGTADAVLSAEGWTRGEPFLAMNADNLYPLPALRRLCALGSPGLPAFDRDDLVATSNIPLARVTSFASLDVDASGHLLRVVEKPGGEDMTMPGRHVMVSMNCWRFDRRIFDACRDVERSARGEYELPEAVMLAIQRGVPFQTFPARGPVLDLSRRADAIEVSSRLENVAVSL